MATARAIAFIALQCFQCSTMQVKQQKRSSNKWTCVVCNEKQSVLKVFARSHMAKDVRGFVQSFNMSRRFSDSRVSTTETAPPQSETEGSGGAAGRKANRIDWTEYLVALEDEDGAGGCGAGPEDERETTMIVTELPDELFKRAKLNTRAYKSGFPKGSSSSSSNLYKRQLSDRSNAKSAVPSVQRSKKVRSDTLLQNSMGRRYGSETEDDAGPRKVQMTGAGRESRWSSYMTEEDGEFLSGVCRDTSQSKFMNDTGRFGSDGEFLSGVCRDTSQSKFMNDTGRFGSDLLETATHDQAVEDDIHPDFI